MEASVEEKFDAAVKVIQSIPRNGAFQPSHSLLLRFYGYYKQATMGPCDIPRPAFYDMTGKAKWEAWNKLGNMSKEEAMNCYVEELKNIIEAMPHTDKVSAFISKLGDFYELVDEKIGEDYRRIKPALHLNGDVSNKEQDSENTSMKTVNDPDVGADQQSADYSEVSDNQTEIVSDSQLSVADEVTANNISHSPVDNGCGSVVTSRDGGTIDDGDGGDDDDDDDDETDEFCDTLDSPMQPVIAKMVDSRGDHNYSVASGAMTTALPRDASSTSLDLGPHQLYDRNWSSQDLQLLDTQADVATALKIEDKDLICDVKTTSSAVSEMNSNTVKHIKDTSEAVGSANPSTPVASRSPDLKGQQTVPKASDVSEQLVLTVKRLQDDMKSAMGRLEVLEKHHNRQKRQVLHHFWWPFGNLSAKATLFFIIWPFIVHWLLSRRRSSFHRQ